MKVGTLVRYIDVFDRSSVGIIAEMSWSGARVQWEDGSVTMEQFDHLEIVWSN